MDNHKIYIRDCTLDNHDLFVTVLHSFGCPLLAQKFEKFEKNPERFFQIYSITLWPELLGPVERNEHDIHTKTT